MKSTLADQLKSIKSEPTDVSEYGKLPVREDIVVLEPAAQKQWDKLRMIRKNLKVVDKYIATSGGETLNEWIAATKNDGISKVVLDKIGSHNDATGGISAYFFNLQKFYDQEEQKYDEIEEKEILPDDIKKMVGDLRADRSEKRGNRAKARKIKLRDLKKDDKGYLVVEIEEPEVLNADGGQEQPAPEPKLENPKDVIEKSKKNIGVWIAGTLILITVITVGVSLTKSNP